MIRARVSFRRPVLKCGDRKVPIGDQRVSFIEVFNGLGERISWEFGAHGRDLAKLLDQARDAVLAAGVEQRDHDELVHRFEVCS